MLVCRRVISSTFSAVLGLSDDSRDGEYVPGSHTAVASTSGASPSKRGRWSHYGTCAGMTTRSAASPIAGFEGGYSSLPLSLYIYALTVPVRLIVFSCCWVQVGLSWFFTSPWRILHGSGFVFFRCCDYYLYG